MPVAIGVTGTDTGAGKTVVASALAATLTESGRRVGVFKPVETGVARGMDPPDASRLRMAAGMRDSIEVVCPYVFAEPVAPLVASMRTGKPVELQRLDAAFARVAADCDVVIVEGAGGWLAPLGDGLTFETLCRRWHLDAVIVAANRLGVLNHVSLTLRAAEGAGVSVRGVILNALGPAPTDVAEETNASVLARLFPPPQHHFVSFPYLPDPGHIPSLVAAAHACDLLSVIRHTVS